MVFSMNVFKNKKRWQRNVGIKNVKKRALNKKNVKTFFTSMVCGCLVVCRSQQEPATSGRCRAVSGHVTMTSRWLGGEVCSISRWLRRLLAMVVICPTSRSGLTSHLSLPTSSSSSSPSSSSLFHAAWPIVQHIMVHKNTEHRDTQENIIPEI